LILFLLVAFIAIIDSNDRKWERMETLLDKLLAETRSRTHVRVVPEGQAAIPGNAWDEYSAAEQQAVLLVSQKAVTDFLNTGWKVYPVEVRNILAQGENAIAHLHSGAQRSSGQYPYRWDRPEPPDGFLSSHESLTLLAATKARVLLEQGHAREAAGVLIDLLTYAGDSARNSTILPALVGVLVYHRGTFNEVDYLLNSGKLDREGMAQFAESLEALDRDFPSMGQALVNDIMGVGLAIRRGEELPELSYNVGTIRGRVNSVFANSLFARGMWADAVTEVEGYMRRMEATEKMHFVVAEAELSRINTEERAATNPMTSALLPKVSSYLELQRSTQTQLRLLRAGASYRVSGSVPNLDDPFGAKLLHKEENGKMKIWSVGTDGRNADGTGDDIVVEVPISK
jgi:hypothetical protein